MDTTSQHTELLTFFKALSDGTRLKIVALLARRTMSVEDLAASLGLHASTISHHLSRLSRVGLVHARAEGYYSMYALKLETLTGMAQRLLSTEDLPAVAADIDLEAYDRKVLSNYLDPDGRVRAFPAQRKKEETILRYVARVFEQGKRYPEKQVNKMLSQFSDDTARLRRHLVDFGFMGREGGGGEYWRK
jgi:predicted transcriptional regulator